MGAGTASIPDRETWLEARRREADELGYATQPEVLIIGGGQGGIALGARLRQLDVPTIVDRPPRAAGRSVARALQVAVPARPRLVRPPAVPEVPRQLAGVLAQGQDRRLAGDVHAGDGAQLLADRPIADRARYDEDAGEWEVTRRARRRAGRRCARGSWCSRPACRASPTGRPSRAGAFAGEQQHSSEHPGPDAYAGKRVVVIGSNNSAFDICGALYEVGADVTMVQRSSTHIVRSTR